MKTSSRIVLAVMVLAAMASAQVPQAGHVIVVLEENHSYSKIIGNSAMPYLNSLASKYGLATNYYANTHPSIGNYLMMTTGQIITNSDGYSGTVSANNMARVFLTAGVSWKSYAESIPSVGYTGGDKYPYVKHHNPFAYFTDVVNSSSEKNNLVPFTHFGQDLANGALPKFSYIVPNQHHNMHDCPTTTTGCTDSQKAAAADNWLKANIAPLLANAEFQKDGLLIITWDEGNSTDTAHGGGKVATVVIGPKVKPGFKSTTFYQHQSLLGTMLSALGASSLKPAAASNAALMSDFFGSGSAPQPPPPTGTCTLSSTLNTVTICTPTDGGTTPTAMHLTAGTTSATAVNYIAVWIDGTKKFTTYSNKLDTTLTLSVGKHRVTVQAKNGAGTTFAKTIYVTAQ